MAITIPKKQSSGGGGLGSIAGTLAGGIAAAATGGAALPLMAAGATLGSTAGNVIAPPSGGGGGASGALGTALGAVDRGDDAIKRAIDNRSSDPVQTIRDGIMATAFMPPGAERASAFNSLHQAHMAALGMGAGGGEGLA